MSHHPRLLRARGTPSYKSGGGEVLRALVYTHVAEHQAWLERELTSLDVVTQIGRNVSDLVAALVEDPPPRPQLLFIDFDALSAGEILHLHGIRELGWFGAVIAIGKVPLALRQSLAIEHLLQPLAPTTAVKSAIANISPSAKTTRVPRITG